MFKIKLWEMDRLWELMGGSCWGLFPPSFYYTHTEEEIERITTNKKTQYQGIEKQRAGVYSICTFQYNGNSSDYMLHVWIPGRCKQDFAWFMLIRRPKGQHAAQDLNIMLQESAYLIRCKNITERRMKSCETSMIHGYYKNPCTGTANQVRTS